MAKALEQRRLVRSDDLVRVFVETCPLIRSQNSGVDMRSR